MSNLFYPLFQKEHKMEHHILSAALLVLVGIHGFLGIDYALGASLKAPTDALASRPEKVSDVRVRAYTDSLYVSWKAPKSKDPIIDYVIQYKPDTETTYRTLEDQVSRSTSSLMKVGKTFSQGNTYAVRVAGKTKSFIGAYSDPIYLLYSSTGASVVSSSSSATTPQPKIVNKKTSTTVSGEAIAPLTKKTTKSIYSWSMNTWGSCSVSCGGGIQNRKVRCQRNGSTVVADSYCKTTKPSTVQACNMGACTPSPEQSTLSSDSAIGTVIGFDIVVPDTVRAGEIFDITVRAVDDAGNIVPSYRGTIIFASALFGDTVPMQGKAISFTAGDNGTKNFTKAAGFKEAGDREVSVVDLNNTDISSSVLVKVLP